MEVPVDTPATGNPDLDLLIATFGIALLVFAALLGASAAFKHRTLTLLTFVVFFLAVASFPLWGSIVFVVLGSLSSTTQDYWSGAARLVIGTSIRYGVLSVIVAALVAVCYFGVSGAHGRKLRIATIAFVVLSICATVYASQLSQRPRGAGDEMTEVVRWTEESDEILAEFADPQPGDVLAASVQSSRSNERGGPPYLYVMSIHSSRTGENLFAIVDVHREGRRPHFGFGCILGVDERGMSTDRCRTTPR